MKKLVYLFALSVLPILAFSQKSNVDEATSKLKVGKISEAYIAIEKAVDEQNPMAGSTIESAHTWLVRGKILRQIYRKNLRSLAKSPLNGSYESFTIAIELDKKGQYSKQLMTEFAFLEVDFLNLANNAFKMGDYREASDAYEKVLDIHKLPLIKKTKDDTNGMVDTVVVFNTGLSSFLSEQWDKSITYLNKSVTMDFRTEVCYPHLYNAHQAMGDTVASLKVLQRGFRDFPENETIIQELINFYINIDDKPERALKYLDLALKNDPENSEFWAAKGASYLRSEGNQVKNAIRAFKKAYQYNNQNVQAMYSLGQIYYNQGTDLWNSASEHSVGSEEYYKVTDKALKSYRIAFPYLEQVLTIIPKQPQVVGTLRSIYYRLDMTEEYNRISEMMTN